MSSTGDPPKPYSADEVNRIWQHGMHEERLFHDRLNYFSFLETGLLTICGIMYNKEPAVGFFLPLTLVGLLFTLLWIVIQKRHWAYCVHVNERIKQLVPDYRATLDAFPGNHDGLSISRPLALSVPVLFAGTWIAFLAWIVFRDRLPTHINGGITIDRVLLVILATGLVWALFRLRQLERAVREKQ